MNVSSGTFVIALTDGEEFCFAIVKRVLENAEENLNHPYLVEAQTESGLTEILAKNLIPILAAGGEQSNPMDFFRSQKQQVCQAIEAILDNCNSGDENSRIDEAKRRIKHLFGEGTDVAIRCALALVAGAVWYGTNKFCELSRPAVDIINGVWKSHPVCVNTLS